MKPCAPAGCPRRIAPPPRWVGLTGRCLAVSAEHQRAEGGGRGWGEPAAYGWGFFERAVPVDCASLARLRVLNFPLPRNQLQIGMSLACGSAAGLVSSTATFPLDLIRRRLQLQGQGGGGRPATFASTFRSVAQVGGLRRGRVLVGRRGAWGVGVCWRAGGGLGWGRGVAGRRVCGRTRGRKRGGLPSPVSCLESHSALSCPPPPAAARGPAGAVRRHIARVLQGGANLGQFVEGHNVWLLCWKRC